ncbi:MAG: hydrolase 2, exosortase A system-associated [Candidatus Polarisedimenticolaceae bacterium]|nr:hydrolase 2, exosortase A system-associated [Candidatus Polarisedimenticolaceae bacterium]
MSKIIDPHPLFLPGPSGQLFALHLPPVAPTLCRQYLIHIPAFAEEMNKARHLVALQARAFAQQGVGVLILDLFGTGDSTGDFKDATWSAWKEDVASAVMWLRQQGVERISLWGLRLGCLLAFDFTQQRRGEIEGLLFWQPLLDGRVALDRFLRLQVAAGALGRGCKDTVQGLRSRLAAEETLEIGGYEISPILVRELDHCSFQSLGLPMVDRVVWVEIRRFTESADSLSVVESGHSPDVRLLPASKSMIDDWQGCETKIKVAQVNGPSFWQSQVTEPMPELLSKTLGLWWGSALPSFQSSQPEGDE